MKWAQIEGNWKQFAGKVKQHWGNLTGDDITKANGKREKLEGVLQARYGLTNEQAKKELDTYLSH